MAKPKKSDEVLYREKLHRICVKLRTCRQYLYKRKKYNIVEYACKYGSDYTSEFKLSIGTTIIIDKKNCDEVLNNLIDIDEE